MKRNPDHFYLNQEEPKKSCFLALRGLILQCDSCISETTKYGMPCFTYKNKVFCYLWADKKTNEPYILFVEGQFLNHPKLESGTRKRMKIYPVDPMKDLNPNEIQIILHQALILYKDGVIKL